jgi:glyoxylase-like metal-dependent hydrolase (beta-lactamase superfamily II)
MSSSALSYAVHVSPGRPTTNQDIPPDIPVRMWSPTSTIVIRGVSEALIVDPGFTIASSRSILDWVAAERFPLTHAYVTHGHGDHWFGLQSVIDRYPHIRAVARPEVVEEMKLQAEPAWKVNVWDAWFPNQLPTNVAIAAPLAGDVITIDGAEIRSIPLGHTDGDHTTCLQVPDLSLVVAGDAVYNNVHLMLAASDAEGRKSWLRALDTVESLNPTAIVAGHKDPEADDDPRQIEETRRYILDFEEGLRRTTSVMGLYEYMLELYPARINHGALWGSCRAAHPGDR